jgi:hypothetical protein
MEDGLTHVFAYLNCLTPCMFVCKQWYEVTLMILPRKSGSARGVRQTGVIRYCARYGYLNVLLWALQEGAPWEIKAPTKATKGNQIDMLNWLRANNKITHNGPIWHTVISGNLQLFEWWKECKTVPCYDSWSDITKLVCRLGRLDMLKAMNLRDYERSAYANIEMIIKNGHIHILAWLLTYRVKKHRNVNRAIACIVVESDEIKWKILEWICSDPDKVFIRLGEIDFQIRLIYETHDSEVIKWLGDRGFI